jgi:hypothetical protein
MDSDIGRAVDKFMAKRNEKHEPKPYLVTVTREMTMAVVATSIAEAERIAEEHADEAASDSYDEVNWMATAKPMTDAGEFAGTGYIPYGPEDDSADRDKSLDEWFPKVAT